MCPTCNIHGAWGILERLIKKAKIDSTLKDFIEKSQRNTDQFEKDWQVIMDSTTSIDKLNETEVLELLRLFEFPVSISNQRFPPTYAFLYHIHTYHILC